jgi:tRNA A-37 threonylcarbamoyl transferase component Bud32
MEPAATVSMARQSFWIEDAPAGYESVVRGAVDYLVREGYCGVLDCVSADGRPITLAADAVPIGQGRTSTARIVFREEVAEQVVFRRGHRGGLAKVVLGDKFIGFRTRMFKEVAVTEHARNRGVPVAEVLAAARVRLAPGLYRGWVITREVRHSENLHALCERESAAAVPDRTRKRAVLRAVAEAVAALHEAGVDHPDLNLRNILVAARADGSLEVHIIDFDRTRVCATVSLARRVRTLARLFRSLVRLDVSRWLTPRDLERFLQVYFRRDGRARRRAIRPLAWAILRLRIHDGWWRLIGQTSCLRLFLR